MSILNPPPMMNTLPYAVLDPLLYTSMFSPDIAEVCEIENCCFTTPWSAETYLREIRENKHCHYSVVRATDYAIEKFDMPPLLGYGGYWLLDHEAHITTLAVRPEWRRNHFGEWILLNMLTSIRAKFGELATLEVRVGNTAAINLYTRLGFREVGLRKGYYQDTHEDALLLTIFGIQDSFIWNDISKRRNDVARQIRVKYGPTPAEIREIEAGYMTDELARNKSTDT